MENETSKKELLQSPNRPAKRNENKRKKRRQNRSSKAKKPETAPIVAEKRKRSGKRQHPIVVPKVHEPLPVCTICDKPIDAIAQAISGLEEGTFSHFDCVLRKIADDERLLPHQKVSYIGRGVFAIVETDSEGNFQFVKRIPYETPEMFQSMQHYVEGRKQ